MDIKAIKGSVPVNFMSLEEKMQAVKGMHDSIARQVRMLQQDYEKDSKKLIEELTSYVGEEFRKVLDEIGPVKTDCVYGDEKATVSKFNVDYNPQYNCFRIKINELKTTNMKVIGDINGYCPHDFIEPLTGTLQDAHPKIKAFMKKYHVELIDEPSNDCEHK